MSTPLTLQVRIILDVEVAVAPVMEASASETVNAAQQRLLEIVLADPALRSFFCRHAAAVPLTDWLEGEPVTGLEWLREEPQRVQDAISRLALAEQGLLLPVLGGRLDGELDGFYAAFRPSYRKVQVLQLG